MVKKHESLIVLQTGGSADGRFCRREVLQTGGSADGRLPIAFCGYGYFEMELNRIQHSAVDLFCKVSLVERCLGSPPHVYPRPLPYSLPLHKACQHCLPYFPKSTRISITFPTSYPINSNMASPRKCRQLFPSISMSSL